jgi:uncharacterized protein YgbK (DUF1537 family)
MRGQDMRAGIIADDFTGATDIASFLANNGPCCCNQRSALSDSVTDSSAGTERDFRLTTNARATVN